MIPIRIRLRQIGNSTWNIYVVTLINVLGSLYDCSCLYFHFLDYTLFSNDEESSLFEAVYSSKGDAIKLYYE